MQNYPHNRNFSFKSTFIYINWFKIEYLMDQMGLCKIQWNNTMIYANKVPLISSEECVCNGSKFQLTSHLKFWSLASNPILSIDWFVFILFEFNRLTSPFAATAEMLPFNLAIQRWVIGKQTFNLWHRLLSFACITFTLTWMECTYCVL